MGRYYHQQTQLIIQRIIEVDPGMIEVLTCLNSIDHLLTLYSCEGGEPIHNRISQPYVLFICANLKIVEAIQDCVQGIGRMTGKTRYDGSAYEYCIHLNSTKELPIFEERLKARFPYKPGD